MKKPASFIASKGTRSSTLLLAVLTASCLSLSAQQAAPDQDLAGSVRELRAQVEELRAAVADIRAEASQYRAESEQLRNEIKALRASSAPNPSATEGSAAKADERIAALEENTQLLQSELRTQYQTKVESASKYRVRLSGIVLLNMFGNHGPVDNLDFPTYAATNNVYGTSNSFGATMRQTELGLEVFGPQLAGAKTSGEVHVDFAGGFPLGTLDGVNTGLFRLRTATARMDWEHTSLIVGQDNLFISPNSPTSFASLAIPSFGYSGNLWAWTPQVRIEHKVDVGANQSFILQAGILDNITGERTYLSSRLPQAGESAGQPAYAARAGWNGNVNGHTAALGVSGYYSRQDWGGPWKVDGWAIAGDWRIPLSHVFEFSGEAFRGRGVGGIGGGIGQSAIFSSDPLYPGPQFRPLNAAGGWSQLKYIANSKLEFNGVFGLDNPFASDIKAFVSPSGTYQTVLLANRSEMVNFVFRPRSALLFSGEYRHLHTTQLNGLNTADQVNATVGVLF